MKSKHRCFPATFYILFAACVSLLVTTETSKASNVVINLDSSSYSIDPDSFAVNDSSSATPSQTLGGITWNGQFVGGDTYYGFFTSATDISPKTGINLIMQLNSGSNPNSGFTIGLVKADFSIASFTGSTSGLLGSPTKLSLAFVQSSDITLADLTDLTGFQFTWDTGGTINATVLGIEAIPEPSSASLVLLGAAGLVALRRLRKV